MKKKLIFLIFGLLFSIAGNAKGIWVTNSSNTKGTTTLFSDSFEDGTSNWTLTGAWGSTTSQNHSGSKSLTESPSGNYGNNTTSYATLANGIDLAQTGILSAELTFWNKYNIEAGFDYMYVDVSIDDFSSYTQVARYDGEVSDWTQQTISLGGFVGNSNVKVRFRFESDGGLELDGMYIDDFTITGNDEDVASPLIVFAPKPFYEASLNDQVIIANIYDVSGIQNAELKYVVDGGSEQTVSSTSSIDEYTFVIPSQTPGAWVEYWIVATDNSPANNTVNSDHYEYISGYYYSYDNGEIDFYFEVGGTNTSGDPNPTAAAVKVTIGDAQLTSLLIRGYTDSSHPNDPMTVVVWDNNSGMPGSELVTISNVVPEATLSNTSAMTRVDLRTYSAQLSGLNGDYFIGFKMPTGTARSTETSPGSYNRSYFFDGSTWESASADIHFRAITTEPQADIEGPSIGYSGEVDYLGTLNDNNVVATISDMSGVASATLYYSIDGGANQIIAGVNTSGDNYEFIIPSQTAGTLVEYYIEAVDGLTPTPYTSTTSIFKYISGIHMINESLNASSYLNIGPATDIPSGAAVKFSLTSPRALVSFLIRNYAVAGTPNSDMLIHVYSDNAGLPGAELITPFSVTPTSTVSDNMKYTYIDLRPYLAQLGNLTGDIFVGFTVATGQTAFLLSSPPTTSANSFMFDGTSWFNDDSNGYQFRAVVSDAPIVNVSEIESKNVLVYPNPTNNILNIVSNNHIKNISVVNITGKTVLNISANSKSKKVDLSDLAKGIYMFNITTENNTITKKVIIK